MNIIKDFIPEGSKNRPQEANTCKYITVHDTANVEYGANAEAHAKYIKTIEDLTSWHYTVDEAGAYQHIPDNEKSYHTSDKFANENSIAIELCVNEDGDFEKTLANAVELVKMLMEKYNIPAENVVTHNDWTGKECPASLLGDGWVEFKALITSSEEAGEITEAPSDPKEQPRWKSIPLWTAIIAILYIMFSPKISEWTGFDMPAWGEVASYVIAALASIFGVANNPTNGNGF